MIYNQKLNPWVKLTELALIIIIKMTESQSESTCTLIEQGLDINQIVQV